MLVWGSAVLYTARTCANKGILPLYTLTVRQILFKMFAGLIGWNDPGPARGFFSVFLKIKFVPVTIWRMMVTPYM